MKPTVFYDASTKKTEARVLIFNASQIYGGFYQEHGFLLHIGNKAPDITHSVFLTQTIYDYLRDSFNWDAMKDKSIQNDWPVLVPSKFIPEYKELITYEVNSPQHIIEQYASIAQEVSEFLHTLNPSSSQKIVRVAFSKIGTLGSWNMQKNTNTLWISLREDTSLENYLYCLINGVLDIDTGTNDWRIAQEIMRLLMKSPRIAELIPQPRIVYDSLEQYEYNPQEKNKSDSLYAGLGFPINHILRKKGDIFYIQGSRPVSNLTKSEHTLLSYLFDHANRTVSYDELADHVWGEGFYSLEALTKMAERVRKKLKQAGLGRNAIATVRGKGYCFVK